MVITIIVSIDPTITRTILMPIITRDEQTRCADGMRRRDGEKRWGQEIPAFLCGVKPASAGGPSRCDVAAARVGQGVPISKDARVRGTDDMSRRDEQTREACRSAPTLLLVVWGGYECPR